MAVIELIIQNLTGLYIFFKHWFRNLFQLFSGDPPLKNLNSEIILITGAASGIGKGLAERLAYDGSTLILWDVDETNNNRVATELNLATKSQRIHAMKCDLTNRENIYDCAKKVRPEKSSKISNKTYFLNLI